MKRITYLSLLVLLTSLVGIRATAHDIEMANSDGIIIYYKWKNNKTELLVTCCGSAYGMYTGNLVIPASVTYNGTTYPVTSIGSNAFYKCSNLSSVTIPSSVTSIGDYAFGLCYSLTSVTIPSSVTSIGNCAFYLCYSLTSITIPSSVTSIGYSVFSRSGLTSVIIPSSVTIISSNAFSECSGLKSVSIPSSVKSIGYSAFSCCSGLLSVTIPEGVTSIGSNAFRDCSGLTSVSIPSSVTSIGSSAFSECSSLTSVTIPSNVESIGDYAFAGCSGLILITVETGNSMYDSRNNCNAIIEIESNTLLYGCNNTIIPSGVTGIGSYAFWNCSGLTSVDIPSSVTSIGESAFEGCSGLTSVTIPSSVTTIEFRAFEGTAWLSNQPDGLVYAGKVAYKYKGIMPYNTTITINDGTLGIAEGAFASCSGLTSVTIPNTVTSIGLFAFNNCSGLTSVTVMMESPVGIGYDTFSNRQNAILYVPYGCKAAYEAADYWNEFKEICEWMDETDITAMENTIYIEPTEERTGTEATISLKMKNTAAIRGFQFDLELPEGVTPVEVDGEYVYWLNADRAPKKAGGQYYHTLEVTKQTDGTYRFLCGAQQNKTFSGNDGEVAVIKVNIADNMKEGDYPIVLRNIKLTETDISNYYQTDEVVAKLTIVNYIPGDISNDGIVDVSDYIGVANHILGNTPAGFNARAADVNNDNVIDVSDYIGIANIILTGSIYGNNNAARFMDEDEEQDPQ